MYPFCRFWVHVVYDVYPFFRFRVHVECDVYPFCRFWVHISYTTRRTRRYGLARLVRCCYVVSSGLYLVSSRLVVIDAYLGDDTLGRDVDVLVTVSSQLYLKAVVRALWHLDEVDIVNALIGILLPECLHDDLGDAPLGDLPARGDPLTGVREAYLLFLFVVPYLHLDHAVIVVHI